MAIIAILEFNNLLWKQYLCTVLSPIKERSIMYSTAPEPGDPTNIIVSESEMGYKLFDTFTGDSRVLDTLAEWVGEFAGAAIPIFVTKNVWAGGAGSATWNTFFDPPTTKYYKTWIYQVSVYYYYYGRHITKQYYDSARTKLIKTEEHLSRVTK